MVTLVRYWVITGGKEGSLHSKLGTQADVNLYVMSVEGGRVKGAVLVLSIMQLHVHSLGIIVLHHN